MNEWQITKEILLSVIKWFLIFVVINNLIWVLIVLSGSPTEIKGKLENVDNSTVKQEIRNG